MSCSEKSIADDSRPVAAALTFIVILLGLGIPVWWNTTAVKRASLPLDQLSIMTPISASDHSFPLTFKSLRDSEKLLEHLTKIKAASKELVKENVNLFPAELSPEEKEIILSVNSSINTLDRLFANLSEVRIADGLSIVEVPDKLMKPGKVILGNHNFIYISDQTDEQDLGKILDTILSFVLAYSDGSKSFNLPISNQYNVLLTLASSNASITYSDMINNFHETMRKFSKKFSVICDITVSSQIVYVGNGPVGAIFRAEKNVHIVNEEKVVSLINALEPRLGSQLSSDPTFHWVVYVPPGKQSPMFIYKNSLPVLSNTVLSPRWNGGGLQIVNQLDLSFVGLVLRQLRDAVGVVPQLTTDGLQILQLEHDISGLHDWEINLLMRHRTIQLLNHAINTLKSLSHLLQQIGNIVVSEEIRDLIINSVDMIQASKKALENGKLSGAYRDAKVAFTCAEKAFFDPSLLSLLYFPEDQKYAIYIPLFLPVGIPVLLSLRSVYKHFYKL